MPSPIAQHFTFQPVSCSGIVSAISAIPSLLVVTPAVQNAVSAKLLRTVGCTAFGSGPPLSPSAPSSAFASDCFAASISSAAKPPTILLLAIIIAPLGAPPPKPPMAPRPIILEPAERPIRVVDCISISFISSTTAPPNTPRSFMPSSLFFNKL